MTTTTEIPSEADSNRCKCGQCQCKWWWYVDLATGQESGPFTDDERADVGNGAGWEWRQ